MKAGKYGTAERLNISVVPGAMDSAQMWLSGYHNAWLVSLSLSIPNIITEDFHFDPILGYGGKLNALELKTTKSRPYIFIDAYGGMDISGLRLEYEVTFCNESMPYSMAEEELGLAASIGSGNMLGDLQVKAGGSMVLNLSKENPAL